MIRIKLLIFDLDGTLIDSRKDIHSAVNFTLNELGLRQRTFDEVVSFIGYGVKDLIRKSLPSGKKQLEDRAVEIFSDYFALHSTDQTVLYPQARQVLEYFRDKSIALVTNRSTRLSEAALGNLGIRRYFSAVFGADDEACLKPSACPLNAALAAFKTGPGSAMIVGDMRVDVEAGKEAGIYTCAVTYGIGKKQEILKAAPDYLIDNLGELKKIIS